MLTKDKKPFTYTPGGIDLSEIRSPTMARRLERNAMNEGVGPVPQSQNQYHPTGPLPPSALAAMQPQLQVQVFPSGGIPQPHHHGGGGPPPPPPPSGMPPPPPPPKGPLRPVSPVPLDNFERPDMTKIIPENPMALLRKTAGPVVKMDPIFNKNNYVGGNTMVDSPPARPPPQPVRQPEPVQTKQSTAGLGSIYVPPVNQNANPPAPPQRQQPQSPPFANQGSAQFANQSDSPTNTTRQPPAYYKRQPPTPQAEPQSPPVMVQRQPPVAAATPPQRDPQTPDSPKATLSKAPTPWLSQKRPQQQQDAPEWAVNDQRGRTIPVVQQEQQMQPEPQQAQRPWQQQQAPQSPPWRQQAQAQSPPQQPESQPWQQRQQKQPESQPWQQRPQQQQQQQPEPQPWQQQQQRKPQTPPWQQQQQAAQSAPIQIPQGGGGGGGGGGVRKQVQSRERPQELGPTERTEVVIVNEPPQVFHHLGTTQRIIVRQPQQNNSQQDSSGVRVIPVKVDGAASNGHGRSFNSPGAAPSTPGNNSDARSLNRQQSWNANPTQSSSFRVLQKITNTDGDDDDDQPVIEHSPKTPQHFPQQRQHSIEQVRKLQQKEGDHELMNKFKQGLDQDSSIHRETDPRYRGPHIPSKAFKLLQSMTGGPDEPPTSSTVPQGQQSNNRGGPKVRTIPIQIEGDGPTKTYVPPSEQTVQEPKKYMGSNIPGRSFKILQAMTAPDDCANPARACENNENYPNDPSSYAQWGYDPNYPPPSPYYYNPYWNYYPPTPTNDFPPNPTPNTDSRMTPIPANWGYYPNSYGQNVNSDSDPDLVKKRSNSSRNTPIPTSWSNDNESAKKQNGNSRCTPVPFWPYYYPNYSYEENQEAPEVDSNGNEHSGEEQQNYGQYPPYWDPYYYGYYYGAPPMYPPVYNPYPYYPPPQTDTEEVSGYSSNDEMAYYGSKFATMSPFSNERPRHVATPSLPKPNTIERPKSVATPTLSKPITNERPKSVATPNLSQQLLLEITQAAKKMEESRRKREETQKEEKIRIQSEPFEDDSSVAETDDSDTEMVGYEVCRPPIGCGLQAKRSVSDMRVYDEDESSHCSDEEEEEEEEETTEEIEDPSSVYVVDETIPHQLSVIFEESERTDSSARFIRESSVATTISEDTATIENSEDEEDAAESDGTVLVKLPLTIKFSVAESQNVATLTVGTSEIKPQVAVKSAIQELCENLDTRLGTTKVDSGGNLLKPENSIVRQVSTDSYQTAESDGETFYNTQNGECGKKQLVESIEYQEVTVVEEEKGEEAEYDDDEDDVDWWGEISKSEDLPAKFIPNKSCKTTEDTQIATNNKDIIENNITTEEPTILSKPQKNNNIYINNRSSDEESIDFWTKIDKDNYTDKKLGKNNVVALELGLAQEHHNALQTEVFNRQIDDALTNTETIAATSSNETISAKPEVTNASDLATGNDLNNQETMESMETVMTNIINTINSRTSANCSDEEKQEEIDFWAEIMDDTFDVLDENVQSEEHPLRQETIDTSSACSRNSSLSSSEVSNEKEETQANGEYKIELSQEKETLVKTEETPNEEIKDESYTKPEPISTQTHIKSPKEETYKQNPQEEDETETTISVKERITTLEDSNSQLSPEKSVHKRNSISRKSSIKSYEEFSEEEEGDSGVTSDVSRHISETDTEPDFLEVRRIKYQRASTHSRLFKLLQDECDNEEVDEKPKEETQGECMQSRRDLLNLPLQKNGSDPESFSSSGFTSPGSPTINDRLVNELIQSLLRRKQGRVFKHMTMEKVQAAALRILQDDMDGLETLSSSEDGGSFLSPKKPGTGSSTPARTPQEFYANFSDYAQYYESWAEAERLYEAQCDILPSKAFRLLQEHASTNKTGAIAGLLARCPRVLSNKNIQKELMKLMEGHNSHSPSPDPPDQPPDASEATSAS